MVEKLNDAIWDEGSIAAHQGENLFHDRYPSSPKLPELRARRGVIAVNLLNFACEAYAVPLP